MDSGRSSNLGTFLGIRTEGSTIVFILVTTKRFQRNHMVYFMSIEMDWKRIVLR